MDDKSLSDQLSNLFPPSEDAPTAQQSVGAERGMLIDSLKLFAGQAGEGIQPVLEQFLSGQGELAEVTRAAAASGSSSALDQVVTMLTSTLKLSPAIARIIAPILLKLAPSIVNQAGAKEPEKAKPRRKTSSTAKKETASSKKKTDKKTTAKPKKASAKPAAKKKPAAKSAKKETPAAKKRKTTRSVAVESE